MPPQSLSAGPGYIGIVMSLSLFVGICIDMLILWASMLGFFSMLNAVEVRFDFDLLISSINTVLIRY